MVSLKPCMHPIFQKAIGSKAAAITSPDSVYVNTTGQPLTNLNKQALASGLYVRQRFHTRICSFVWT
jgi:hypothetical protein